MKIFGPPLTLTNGHMPKYSGPRPEGNLLGFPRGVLVSELTASNKCNDQKDANTIITSLYCSVEF